MATRPRRIVPGQSVFVTGRAIHREFRFLPTKRVTWTTLYCLGLVASKYSVAIHAFVWMSNHYHLVLTDREAELPDFMRDLNSLLSKALNAIRGFRGENFERRGYNVVVVADGEKLLHHCAYTEANPCLSHLVEHARDWGGVTSASMSYGDTIRVTRPDFGLWGEGSTNERTTEMEPRRAGYRGITRCPEVVSLRLDRPPCLDGEQARTTRANVNGRVLVLEKGARDVRKEEGRTVLGMKGVLNMQFRDSPDTQESYFGSIPEVSGEDPQEREELRRELRAFERAYRHALELFKSDRKVEFPFGTWWMKRCLGVTCSFCPI